MERFINMVRPSPLITTINAGEVWIMVMFSSCSYCNSASDLLRIVMSRTMACRYVWPMMSIRFRDTSTLKGEPSRRR